MLIRLKRLYIKGLRHVENAKEVEIQKKEEGFQLEIPPQNSSFSSLKLFTNLPPDGRLHGYVQL